LGELVQLQVISLSPSAAGASSYILFLQAETSSHLGFPMVIGINEAQAISMFMEDIIPARPLTHDLFANYIKASGGNISYVEITSFTDGVFYAKIFASNGDYIFEVDARPSDSIALALRLHIPIFIKQALLNDIAIPLEHLSSDEDESAELDYPLNETSPEEIIAALEESLSKALAEENYEEAAKLRDQLNQLTK
jgi:bifunctional DNase/RNase